MRLYLVVQCTDEGDSPFDPVSLTAICRQLHRDHVVGGMTGCRQGPYRSTHTAVQWHEDICQIVCIFPSLHCASRVSEEPNVPAQGVGYVLWVESTELQFQTLRETGH